MPKSPPGKTGLVPLNIVFHRYVEQEFPRLSSLTERHRSGDASAEQQREAADLSKQAHGQFLELLTSGRVPVFVLNDGTSPLPIPPEIWKSVFFPERAFLQTGELGQYFPPPYNGRIPMAERSAVQTAVSHLRGVASAAAEIQGASRGRVAKDVMWAIGEKFPNQLSQLNLSKSERTEVLALLRKTSDRSAPASDGALLKILERLRKAAPDDNDI